MEDIKEGGSSAAVMILQVLMLSEETKASLCSCFTHRFNETIGFTFHHLQTDYCGVDFIFILCCELLLSAPPHPAFLNKFK